MGGTLTVRCPLPIIEREATALSKMLFDHGGRVLLYGAPGAGKSHLAAELARSLATQSRCCTCLSADPGSPALGPPGAISLGVWKHGSWQVVSTEALCTLDAGRFRLPLVEAAQRLAKGASRDPLLIDAPGVIRGVAGAELLLALVTATRADTVLCLVRDTANVPLRQELCALSGRVFIASAAVTATRPGKRVRERQRTHAWNRYLDGAPTYRLDFAQIRVIGTPPPPDLPGSWIGRLVALIGSPPGPGALGEVLAADAETLTLRSHHRPPPNPVLLVRDAQRSSSGQLGSARPGTPDSHWVRPPPDMLPGAVANPGPRPLVRLASVTATLVNGMFGDPLLHLRLRQQKRSLLIDLGESTRLAARVAHQTDDVFVSHAHFDHIAGFMWLLRSRIGVTKPCRLYGPPGLTRHVLGLMSGVQWDRIGDLGPRFEIIEVHGDHLHCHELQAGKSGARVSAQRRASQGELLDDDGFRVRAVTLDHGIPVLAFAFETRQTVQVRKDRLQNSGVAAGPWIGDLKRAQQAGQQSTSITLPDGRRQPAGELAAELLRIVPGQKLVYATDLADTADNRDRLVEFAHEADALFCEAAFANGEATQARRTGHLTAGACGEIATRAGVQRLIPFHFSRRYQDDPFRVYGEVQEACARTLTPGLALR